MLDVDCEVKPSSQQQRVRRLEDWPAVGLRLIVHLGYEARSHQDFVAYWANRPNPPSKMVAVRKTLAEARLVEMSLVGHHVGSTFAEALLAFRAWQMEA